MPCPALRAALALPLLAAAAPAQFVVDSSGNPTGTGVASSTENVDFADVDLDGDWDAVFADGGDDGNDQNRIWINRGGLQAGPIGDFLDQTSTRFPQQVDDSRDIEFADIDNDGDVDLYVSNTAQLSNQGNKWWVNNGFAQGGTLGFYADETAQRWIDLGGPGSSIAPSLVTQGTFVDWSCDCDFGDLDNDGDLDLVHSSYGGAFGGNVPTRIFLNDGTGHFAEFNPGGGQLTGNTIPNGAPAIWAQGVQQANTTNTTGAQADIASSALDIDVGDIDGDFDLDILHGARQEAPRMFENRLQENGGSTLGFRDVTGATFPASYWSGGDNYEQELGDLDLDGDLDIYGLNWPGFNDATYRNDGNGVYTFIQSNLASSSPDDNEADFLDYDSDGDLDVFVANFSGANRLYRNDGGNLTLVQTGLGNGTSLDADAADIDGDGDLDVIVAQDNNTANTTLINTVNVPDTVPPYVPRLEDVANGAAAKADDPVRAQVYDNAPYYVTWYNATVLEVEVNGRRIPDVPMRSSQGNVFRGVLDGHLVGAVQFRVRSTDEHGNAGFSAYQSYTNTGYAGTLYGSGTNSSLGAPPTMLALCQPFGGERLYLAGDGVAPGSASFLVLSSNLLSPGWNLGDGLVQNVQFPMLFFHTALADADGLHVLVLDVPQAVAGWTVYAQHVAVDGQGASTLASSRGLELLIQ
ncbi:MAG TPA: VCBS repeat-containing protein, partial [Planctomycetota bacterium]|nr:VCBS repeat-containing protein [Planctomycetota bacterium]